MFNSKKPNIEKLIRKSILKNAKSLREKFQTAHPFRHLVIDDFFTEEFLADLINEFPTPRPDEMFNEYGDPSAKHVVTNVREIGASYKKLDEQISSSSFSDFMSSITEIDSLIYDPSYYGGGTHNNLRGQGMDPHVDFNYLELPNLGKVHRRINAIVYLNQQWDHEWGGSLDLHENPYDPANDKIISILPILNRMVIFETNEFSWHGFQPVSPCLPEGVSRKSFAIYMYTRDRPANEVFPEHGTFYVPRIPVEILEIGQPVTKNNIDILNKSRSHALALIKNQYKREMKLGEYINDRLFEIENLKKELHLIGNSEKTLKVIDYGPRAVEPGEVPNKQPDGSLGFWVRFDRVLTLDEVEIIFNGQRALVTSVQGEFVTAAIDANQSFQPGDKHVFLRSALSGSLFPVGVVRVKS